ncbi:MAG: hypothetical protein IPM98_03940 [Lewinellaceae bacterium]|nr:hypothetical protein [Lewinellaceae bacterium]
MKKIFTLLFLSLLAASKVAAQCACDFVIDFEPDPNNQCCFEVYYCNNGGPACTPGLNFNELHIYTNSNISFTEPIAGVTASFSGITAVQAGTFEAVFTGDFGAYSQECVSRIHIGQICLGGGSQPSVGVEFSAQMNIPNGAGLCSLTVSNTTFDIYDCEAPPALFEKLYGDSSENRPTAIKAFGDGIYVAGYRVVNGEDYGTFAKFDLSTGALVWEKQMSIPSRILDFENIPPPWSVTEEFLLVGHTPFVASPIPLDNRSFLMRLDDTGTEVFFKNFDQTGREHFDRILFPSLPADYQFPYYLVGRKNPVGQPQTDVDKVVLYNVDANGVHNWGREYTYNSFPAGDDEFHLGVIPRGNGNLLLMGNDAPNNDGIIVEVNGFTGAVVGSGKRYLETLDIYDGLVLFDGNTLIVGEYFHPDPAQRSAFAVVLDGSLTPVAGKRFPSIASFKDIWADQYGNLWTIGENKDFDAQNPHNFPVVIALEYTSMAAMPQLGFIGGRYLHDGETEFANGVISVTPNHDRIFYADARRTNPAGFGDWDMLVGAFDLGMTSDCSQAYDKSSFDFVFAKTDVPITSVVIPEPPFTTAVSMLPYQYGCSNFCDNCDLSIGFDVFRTIVPKWT